MVAPSLRAGIPGPRSLGSRSAGDASLFLTDRQVRRTDEHGGRSMGDYRPSHVAVRRPRASLRFFCDGLGFEQVEASRWTAPRRARAQSRGAGPEDRVAVRQNDTMKIELLHFVEPVGTPSASRTVDVDDLDAATAPRECRDLVEETRASPGSTCSWLADPDGVRRLPSHGVPTSSRRVTTSASGATSRPGWPTTSSVSTRS